MAKAFLSHSSSDKKLVENIANELGRNNIHYDKFTFEAGKETLKEIFAALDDTDVFVLFISEKALKSKWVKEEILIAKQNLDQGIINRIFPLIIDSSITHKDYRIPKWLRKPYNLKGINNEVLILKKVKQFLREVNYFDNKHIQELNNLFVGRADLIQEFETKIINIENKKPTCIIAYNFFEGMGRRTFLKNALIKTKIIDPLYEPLIIPIESKESIEDFIYKLNLIHPDKQVFSLDLSKKSIEQKIEVAKKSLNIFLENNEIIFIVDDGSIVLPNSKIVDWFEKLISNEVFVNKITICLISKFRPDTVRMMRLGNMIAFKVQELSKPDTTTLFLQYLRFLNIDISTQDKKEFVGNLTGIPAQTIYAANLIQQSDALYAKQHIKNVVEYSDLMALSILDFFSDNQLAQQILIVMSKFEIMSFELVYKIFGESDTVNQSLQSLLNMSVFSFVFADNEYIKLNTAVADYVNRSRLVLINEYNDRLKVLVNESISKDLDDQLQLDYSEFLFTLQNMIREGKTIPSKFFLPSFVLKNIVQSYYNNKYKIVIKLCNKLLENAAQFHEQIIRETRYWLCLAYSRENDERFFQIISEFKSQEDYKDYNFLLGFYYRNDNRMDLAERHYLNVLNQDQENSRTKRELVNVYLRQGEYLKALQLAEDNFYKFRTNIFHAQAYFTCLIKKHKLTTEDKSTLLMLLDTVKSSFHKKSADIYRTMDGEYQYYVKSNMAKAIELLNLALKLDKNKNYALRSLKEIYKKNHMESALQKLLSQYPNADSVSEDEDL